MSYGVACPTCGDKFAAVTDTREQWGGVRRTRTCQGCGQRFKTIERLAAAQTPRELQLERTLRDIIRDTNTQIGG